MYSIEEEAIHFVFKAFNDMKRKKEDISLAFHNISVAFMLQNENYNKEIVLTALLHDIIPKTKYTYEDIKNKFGENIANNILMLNDDNNIKDYKEKKSKFISSLYNCPEYIIIIELANKLQNLLSDYELFKKEGKKALTTKNATYELTKWYHLEILKLFEEKIEKNNNLLIRYKEMLNIYFND